MIPEYMRPHHNLFQQFYESCDAIFGAYRAADKDALHEALIWQSEVGDQIKGRVEGTPILEIEWEFAYGWYLWVLKEEFGLDYSGVPSTH